MAINGDNTLFRSQDRDLGNGVRAHPVTLPTDIPASPVRQPGFSKQLINSIKWARDEIWDHSDCGNAVGKTNTCQLHVHQELARWGMDDELLGHRGVQDNGQTWGSLGTIRASGPDSGGKARFVPGMRTPDGAYQVQRWLPLLSGTRLSGSVRFNEFRSALCPTSPSTQYWNGDSNLGSKQAGRGNTCYSGPGGRNVRPIQHLPQVIPGALHQRCRTTWWARTAGSARTAERSKCWCRHGRCPAALRADDASLVDGQRRLLNLSFVVGIQRGVDAHRAAIAPAFGRAACGPHDLRAPFCKSNLRNL